MEKQQESTLEPCESMTTVIMKDYTPGMDYPDPPPSYKTAGRSSTAAVQITKIIAISGIIIAAMISFALISSAWLAASASNGLCQGTQPKAEPLSAPQQLLQSALLKSIGDLDAAERKLEEKDKNESSEEDSAEGQGSEDEGEAMVTILDLPMALKDMFGSGTDQRIPLKCALEKSNSEGGGSENRHKILPPLFALNVSSDSRCLRFTGENISICCDLGGDEVQGSISPDQRVQPSEVANFPLLRTQQLPPPFSVQSNRNSVVLPSATAHQPLQVIGPIPLNQRSPSLPDILNELWGGRSSGGLEEMMIPLLQANSPDDSPNFNIQVQELGLGPIFIPQGQQGGHLSTFLNLPRSSAQRSMKLSTGHHHAFGEAENQEELPLLLQASELRQRALHQPIPLVPRHHFPHVIRPRSPGVPYPLPEGI